MTSGAKFGATFFSSRSINRSSFSGDNPLMRLATSLMEKSEPSHKKAQKAQKRLVELAFILCDFCASLWHLFLCLFVVHFVGKFFIMVLRPFPVATSFLTSPIVSSRSR